MDDSSQNFFKFEKLCIKLFENLGFNVKYEEYSSIFAPADLFGQVAGVIRTVLK